MPEFYYATKFCGQLNAKNMADFFAIIKANNSCYELKRALRTSECTCGFHFQI